MRKYFFTVCNFVKQSFFVFSVMVLFICAAGIFIGDAGKKCSLYQLGKAGIAYETIFQIVVVAMLITAFNMMIFSEQIFKNLMALWRSILLLASIIIIIIGAVLIFRWFPANDPLPWIAFFISFGGCFALSAIIMLIKTRLENEKYEKLLTKYKEKNEDYTERRQAEKWKM